MYLVALDHWVCHVWALQLSAWTSMPAFNVMLHSLLSPNLWLKIEELEIQIPVFLFAKKKQITADKEESQWEDSNVELCIFVGEMLHAALSMSRYKTECVQEQANSVSVINFNPFKT